MSIAQTSELFQIVADYKKLKDHADGLAQIEGQARSIASTLNASELFNDTASDEEKALVSRYLTPTES